MRARMSIYRNKWANSDLFTSVERVNKSAVEVLEEFGSAWIEDIAPRKFYWQLELMGLVNLKDVRTPKPLPYFLSHNTLHHQHLTSPSTKETSYSCRCRCQYGLEPSIALN